MIVPKSKEEIAEEIRDVVASKTGLNTNQEGTVVRAIIDSFTEEMSYLYRQLEIVQDAAYLSTSQGNYTDLISELVNIQRNKGEQDDSLKQRATESVYTAAGGNRVAIESVLDRMEDVSAYELKDFTHGPGSFTVFVYPQVDGINETLLLTRVREALSDVVSDGVFFDVEVPEGIIVDMSVVLAFTESTSELKRNELKGRVRAAIVRYINQLRKDEVLVINEIVQRAMAISDSIQDMGIANFELNGKNQVVVNTFPKSNQEFRPGEISVG
ncbi:baseplate J/gp47 family protein [Tetragenococcus halophilus]|uniref:baseplate J/gp47 family protein n=1 Tax=Tetragenococcus halophilus TaxID=51669 RepID=UPI00300F87FF